FDELLHDEVRPGRGLADLVNRHDIRMIERRRRAHLSEEALDGRRFIPARLAHQLDRDGAIQPRVEGAEDLAHAAVADGLVDSVMSDRGRYHESGSGLCLSAQLYTSRCTGLSRI